MRTNSNFNEEKYISPAIELIEVSMEKGIAFSATPGDGEEMPEDVWEL